MDKLDVDKIADVLRMNFNVNIISYADINAQEMPRGHLIQREKEIALFSGNLIRDTENWKRQSYSYLADRIERAEICAA